MADPSEKVPGADNQQEELKRWNERKATELLGNDLKEAQYNKAIEGLAPEEVTKRLQQLERAITIARSEWIGSCMEAKLEK